MDASKQTGKTRQRIKAINESFGLIALIKEDINRFPSLANALSTPGFWVVMSYRLSHWLSKHYLGLLGLVIQLLCFLIFNCDISRRASLGPGIGLFHPMGIFIGPNVVMGKCCNIGPNVFIGANREPDDPADYPVLGDYVILGATSQVYGGVSVGDRVRIGPGAVIFKDIPDGYVVLSPVSRSFKRDKWDYEKLGKKDW